MPPSYPDSFKPQEPTLTLLTRDQVRQFDRLAIDEYGIPSLILMENAGRNLADVLLSLGVAGTVLICAGKGNNGGDGLVAARHLVNHGRTVKILLFADDARKLSPECAVHWNIVQRMHIPADLLDGSDLTRLDHDLRQAEWVVDGLFGTGLTGAVRPPFDEIIARINASRKKVLAVDIPSGLDADTGQPFTIVKDGAVVAGSTIRAAHTVTFVAAKTGFANPSAEAWLGKVHVVDIGAPLLSVAASFQLAD